MRDSIQISAQVSRLNYESKDEYFEDDGNNFLNLIKYLEKNRNSRIKQFFLEGERIVDYGEIVEPR